MRTDINAEGAAGARELAAEGISTTAPRSFMYKASAWEFGDVTLMTLEGRAFEVKGPVQNRNQELICCFVQHGEITLLGACSIAIGPGSTVILPRWSNFHALVRGTTSVLMVRFSVDVLEGMLPHRPEQPVHVQGSRLARASRAFIRALVSKDSHGSAVETYATGQLLAEMVGGMLLDSLGYGTEDKGTSVSIRDRARAVIAQSHADSQLNSQVVASEINVSLRHVQNAFAEINTTISEEIRAHRLAAAESLLTSVRYQVLSIEDIAERVGFGSAVNMRRAFHHVGKPSPSKIRNRSW